MISEWERERTDEKVGRWLEFDAQCVWFGGEPVCFDGELVIRIRVCVLGWVLKGIDELAVDGKREVNVCCKRIISSDNVDKYAIDGYCVA